VLRRESRSSVDSMVGKVIVRVSGSKFQVSS
jgi:hypothetical protein